MAQAKHQAFIARITAQAQEKGGSLNSKYLYALHFHPTNETKAITDLEQIISHDSKPKYNNTTSIQKRLSNAKLLLAVINKKQNKPLSDIIEIKNPTHKLFLFKYVDALLKNGNDAAATTVYEAFDNKNTPTNLKGALSYRFGLYCTTKEPSDFKKAFKYFSKIKRSSLDYPHGLLGTALLHLYGDSTLDADHVKTAAYLLGTRDVLHQEHRESYGKTRNIAHKLLASIRDTLGYSLSHMPFKKLINPYDKRMTRTDFVYKLNRIATMPEGTCKRRRRVFENILDRLRKSTLKFRFKVRFQVLHNAIVIAHSSGDTRDLDKAGKYAKFIMGEFQKEYLERDIEEKNKYIKTKRILEKINAFIKTNTSEKQKKIQKEAVSFKSDAEYLYKELSQGKRVSVFVFAIFLLITPALIVELIICTPLYLVFVYPLRKLYSLYMQSKIKDSMNHDNQSVKDCAAKILKIEIDGKGIFEPKEENKNYSRNSKGSFLNLFEKEIQRTNLEDDTKVQFEPVLTGSKCKLPRLEDLASSSVYPTAN